MAYPCPNRHVVPTSVLTWSRLVPLIAARPVTTTVPQTTVKNQRPVKHVVNKAHSPIRKPINQRPAPKHRNFYKTVTIVKVNRVNAVKGTKRNWQALKDKGVIDSCCLRHMNGNISYLSDFEEINGGYVAFSGNPKGGKITGKVVTRNQPNHNAGIQENLDVGTVRKEAASVQQYVLLPLWFNGSKNPQNTDVNAAFDVKEHEYEVHVSPSSSDKTKKHDEKTKREAKGKSPVDFSTRVRNLSDEFEDFSSNSTNRVNAASYCCWDMPTLEDIIYSDDEEDVGAEADFSNLETSISEEGIDYKEVFAPVARIEAIQLFLAYTSFMGFMVYQMDVKSEFLYGTIKEKVYVCQPSGFEDPDYPDKVYKVVKALYGLHQAPKAWYETLANYLLKNDFKRGKIDQTLFIKKQKGDILLVQKEDGIFISQDKYVAEILRKFGLTYGKSASSSIDTKKPLLKDPDGEDVDVHIYRSMIGSLMYLTSLR
uniref:Reverse transcriptase Ty1/copia-type domain-containing protein n=1 Tax=Tanacetum cinerariifolium TaxID=118510 RepID=A0A699H0F1_TANCI|nr:hypothetical protein [Tanacetum cinerariifolium]